MDSAPAIASILHDWLRRFGAPASTQGFSIGPDPVPPASTFSRLDELRVPEDPSAILPALAALCAEALAHGKRLWIVTADDAMLPELSNALDLALRPLCLVMPGAEHAGHVALRATLSLLKSRLARAGADSTGPVWDALRKDLQREDTLWRACLAWNARGLQREAPPPGIASLFPVRIGPWPVAERLKTAADWVMLVEAQRLPVHLRCAWPGAQCTLMLAALPLPGNTALAALDACSLLRAEIEVLGQELSEMELDLATARCELAVFSEDYHARIAWRLAEIDRLESDLARLRLEQAPDDQSLREAAARAHNRSERSERERQAHAGRKGEVPTSFDPGSDMKKRFRQLAQKIHPDRADNETDRAWRTQLMSEANRAYRAGDMAALDEVLALWLEGLQAGRPTGPVPSPPTFSEENRLAAEASRIRQRIGHIALELDRLYGSKLYELFAAGRVAARQGRDLLVEIADRLDQQIARLKDEIDRVVRVACTTATA